MITALAASATLLLTIQIAKTDITPSESLPLGGYTERGAKGFMPGGGRLYSRAIVLRQGKLRIAVVSVEMLTVPESLVREVRAKLPRDIKLFLTATHTHSAPDSQMLNERMTMNVPGIANFRPRWLDWYAEKIAGSVMAALGSRARPVQNFLLKRPHMPLNRGRREGALPDQTATAILAETGSSPIPLWFHYAAHAVFQDSDNLKLSGDWPGAIGGSGYSVLTGAIGDASPVADGATAAARIATFKLTTLDAIARTQVVSRSPAGPLAWTSVPIQLAPTSAHPDFARLNRIPSPLAQDLVNRFAPRKARISALRIGSLAIVGVPGEPTSALGRKIVAEGRRLGFYPVLVVSHVNGWMGYILDPEDYDRGGYEATLSFYGREQGGKVVEAAATALRRLKQSAATGG